MAWLPDLRQHVSKTASASKGGRGSGQQDLGSDLALVDIVRVRLGVHCKADDQNIRENMMEMQ